MIRATTPTHIFTIDSNIDLSAAKNIRLTYSQNGFAVLDKNKNDLVINGKTLTYFLSQEDTLLFKTNTPIEIQITVKTAGDIVMKSGILSIRADRALNTEVFEDED